MRTWGLIAILLIVAIFAYSWGSKLYAPSAKTPYIAPTLHEILGPVNVVSDTGIIDLGDDKWKRDVNFYTHDPMMKECATIRYLHGLPTEVCYFFGQYKFKCDGRGIPDRMHIIDTSKPKVKPKLAYDVLQ